VAAILRDWLPNVIQSVDPWMAESDIDIGSRWGPDLDKELEKANFGILCLTPENIDSTWIHYEAGALSKSVDKARVCPFLLGLQPTDVKGPLVNFQMAKATKEDTMKLVQTINRACAQSDKVLPDERISAIFEKFWPDLQIDLDSIRSETPESLESFRSSEDIIAEILETVRELVVISSNIQKRMPHKNLQDALMDFKRTMQIKLESEDPPISHILTPTFFQQKTCYNSLDNMMDDARKFMGLEEDEPISFYDDKFKEFLSDNTDFRNWAQMIESARSFYWMEQLMDKMHPRQFHCCRTNLRAGLFNLREFYGII
jgi:hypothetical protein